jgi:predicted DNA-binding protein (UPF0251 family)
MSPRVKRIRKVLNPPSIKGFKPYGPETGMSNPDPVLLLYEEYEALRLCDYDRYNHNHASVIMGVSRPTYTRIYARAREKVAKAFVEGRQITIEGGKVYFDSDWYQCSRCQCYFNNPEKDKYLNACPLCGSIQFSSLEQDEPFTDHEPMQCKDDCICPECGFEREHTFGQPCRQQVCPKCGTVMVRKLNP